MPTSILSKSSGVIYLQTLSPIDKWRAIRPMITNGLLSIISCLLVGQSIWNGHIYISIEVWPTLKARASGWTRMSTLVNPLTLSIEWWWYREFVVEVTCIQFPAWIRISIESQSDSFHICYLSPSPASCVSVSLSLCLSVYLSVKPPFGDGRAIQLTALKLLYLVSEQLNWLPIWSR